LRIVHEPHRRRLEIAVGLEEHALRGEPSDMKIGGGRTGPAVEDEADRPSALGLPLGLGEPVIGMKHLRCGTLLLAQHDPFRDDVDVRGIAGIARPGDLMRRTFRRPVLLLVVVGCGGV
jgi:hypothetical protein